MKKNLLPLFVISILALFLLSACNSEHVHDFSEWSVSVEAGCKTDGKRIRSCSCGESESESVPAIGHNYEDGICTNCNADEPSPAEYFIFTELEDGTYSVKAADPNTISGKIVIPSEHNGKRVTKIETSGFNWCSKITEIVISEGIVLIDTVAFSGCSSLEKIIIPKGITEIPTACFADCDELTKIVLPDGITKICHSAFLNCTKLKKVEIGEGLKVIEDWAFKNCLSLESINIPDGTESIGMSCFTYTALIEIKIPGSVKLINNEAFLGIWPLEKIYLSSNNTRICDSAFDRCSHISDVYFSGSEEDWKKVIIGPENDDLTSATLHYNYSGN
ncbi:MAG: leucine-rich repeat domain-containing protein [Clostridia bacterium]|nr:leucine-rich repeat domain-containing protein [Clostridia bacterium]